MMKMVWVLLLLFAVVALGACNLPFVPTSSPEATPLAAATGTPTLAGTPLPSRALTDVSAPSPSNTRTPSQTPEPSDTAEPTATTTRAPLPPTATPSPTPFMVHVEPTSTPRPGDERARIGELPLSEPGHYVNVAFGYWLQYPADWYTGFGQRPLQVSFSDLDPGTHNRNSMRAEGCLIEINAATSIHGFGFKELMGQLPLSFPSAEEFELDGQAAFLVKRSSGDNPFDSEAVYVGHEDRLYVLTLDQSREARDVCSPVWQTILHSWQWFTPQFSVYRSTDHGYAISHPRSWYRFNAGERGVWFSSTDPSDVAGMADLLADGMVCRTNVTNNPKGLPLRKWLAAQDWVIDVTDSIEIEGLLGMRVIRQAVMSPGVQEMDGYYQGPLGKIYAVTCLYPEDLQTEFRPIANAIIYSFEF
ncbi:hypothetical protein ACFLUM_01010 [Chloroflexota bacterium]